MKKLLAQIIVALFFPALALAVPTLVQSVKCTTYNTTNTVTCTFPGAVTVGNFVSCGTSTFDGTNAAVSNTGSVVDNKGNSAYTRRCFQDSYPAGQKLQTAIYAIPNITNGGSSFNVVFSPTTPPATFYLSMVCSEWTGVATSSEFDVTNNAQAAGTAVASGAATTTTTNQLALGVMNHNGAAAVITAEGTWTLIGKYEDGGGDPNTMPISSIYKVVASASSVNAQWTMDSSMQWSACLATFKEAAGGAAAPKPFGLLGVGK